MTYVYYIFGIIIFLYIVCIITCLYHKHKKLKTFKEKVNLDLNDLIDLLPENIKNKTFVKYKVARIDKASIEVGLIYDDEKMRMGNPANVGLIFDKETGNLKQIIEDGIGMGIK